MDSCIFSSYMKYICFISLCFSLFGCVLKPPIELLNITQQHKIVAIESIKCFEITMKEKNKLMADTTGKYYLSAEKILQNQLQTLPYLSTVSYINIGKDSTLAFSKRQNYFPVTADAYLEIQINIAENQTDLAAEMISGVITALITNRSRVSTKYLCIGTLYAQLYDKEHNILDEYVISGQGNNQKDFIQTTIKQLVRELPYQKRFYKP